MGDVASSAAGVSGAGAGHAGPGSHAGRAASLALVRALWRVNAAEELQYRASFFASLLGTIFWLATAILTV
ncbi:MAG TPA: hypothetical protein VF832_03300, partial [Longimicrobiales bacterium]